MKRRLLALALVGTLGTGSEAQAQIQSILYQQNFDQLVLGDSVNERRGPQQNGFLTDVATSPNSQPRSIAFTHVGPNGWTVDNNFDNFGDFDATNANGTNVFSTDPEPKLMYKVAPVGRVVGNNGVPNLGSAENGVDEWAGWSFASLSPKFMSYPSIGA